jgi:glycosyltransferase involved in cell wall biosynthesis
MLLNVLIFSNEPETSIENYPDKHYMWNIIKSSEITTFSQLTKLIRKFKPVVLCYTGNIKDWPTLQQLPYEYTKILIHFDTLKSVSSSAIEDMYISSITRNNNTSMPLFSVITTSFHSGNKIFRPYESLKNQTYTNWEWILWDDSKEEHNDTWNQLIKFQDEDIRIQCFRAPQHSGYIGEMKWRSAALSKGDWIVELDHDDIIDNRLFQWCNEAIAKYPDAEFICSNDIELYEENENESCYGDFISFGYNCYHKEWLRGKWHSVYHVPHINPKTLRHIVGIPNHVRIWKRTFYEKIGKHHSKLPVCDDYELLLRTILNGKLIVLEVPAYFQFRNAGGNNFTFLRNSLIQYLSDKIRDKYSTEIDNNPKFKDYKEIYKDIYKVWQRNLGFSYNKGFYTYVPNITDNTVSIILTVDDESSFDIISSVDSIINQTYNDWLIYIIGNNSPILDKVMNDIRNKYNDNIINKIRWWNLSEKHDRQVSLNYAHRMLVNTELISYLEVGKKWDNFFLSNSINKLKSNNLDFVINDDTPSLYNSVHKYSLLQKFDYFSDDSICSLKSCE